MLNTMEMDMIFEINTIENQYKIDNMIIETDYFNNLIKINYINESSAGDKIREIINKFFEKVRKVIDNIKQFINTIKEKIRLKIVQVAYKLLDKFQNFDDLNEFNDLFAEDEEDFVEDEEDNENFSESVLYESGEYIKYINKSNIHNYVNEKCKNIENKFKYINDLDLLIKEYNKNLKDCEAFVKSITNADITNSIDFENSADYIKLQKFNQNIINKQEEITNIINQNNNNIASSAELNYSRDKNKLSMINIEISSSNNISKIKSEIASLKHILNYRKDIKNMQMK